MEIEIAWATVFKIAFMGIVTYVLVPVLLIVRDGVLWWVINKLILNQQVMVTLGSYCLDKAWLDEGYNTPFGIYGADKDQKFFLGSRQVSPDIFFNQKEHWEKLTESTSTQWQYLQSVEKRIDRVLMYYKQTEENPLRQNRENLYKSFVQSFIDERKKINQSNDSSQHDVSKTGSSI